MEMGTENLGAIGLAALQAAWCDYFLFPRCVCPLLFVPHYEQGLACVVLPLVGLDAGKIKQVGIICGQESTRRIGDYKVKYGYTDIDLLR